MTTWTRMLSASMLAAFGLLTAGPSLAVAAVVQSDGGNWNAPSDPEVSINERESGPAVLQPDGGKRFEPRVVDAEATSDARPTISSAGFRWEDAGLGAAVGATTTLLIGAAYFLVRRKLRPVHF